jgi:hypothetical protein
MQRAEHCLITLTHVVGRPHRGWKILLAIEGTAKFALTLVTVARFLFVSSLICYPLFGIDGHLACHRRSP